MRIEIVKRADGAGVLRCVRPDGSVTWQKQTRHAAHFALHDLTHYAVETALGYRRGFFGLIAEGWDIEDTSGKGGRGALPAEALEVERIVGLFDSERGAPPSGPRTSSIRFRRARLPVPRSKAFGRFAGGCSSSGLQFHPAKHWRWNSEN